MITCKLGDKEYRIDFIAARALREVQPALEAYGQINAAIRSAANGEPRSTMSIEEAMDRLVKWFCTLFNNQFTPEMVYDLFPAERIMHDLLLAVMAVNSGASGSLGVFPTPAPVTKQGGLSDG